jgi:hypothetical protein
MYITLGFFYHRFEISQTEKIVHVNSKLLRLYSTTNPRSDTVKIQLYKAMEDLFLAGKYIHVICYGEIVVVKGMYLLNILNQVPVQYPFSRSSYT